MQGVKRTANGKIKLKSELLSLEDQVLYTTIPFSKINYEEQIKEKSESAVNFICKLCDLILTRNPSLGSWIQRQQEINRGLFCHVDQMIRTSNPNGYRAKCDFRVGIEEATGLLVLGFQASKKGILSVRPGDKMIHLPHQMKLVVKFMEDYIRMSSLPAYNSDIKIGFWHHILIRVSMAGEVMLTVVVNVGDLKVEDVEYVKSDLTNYFFNGDARVANVHALYYHPYDEKKEHNIPTALELLAGVPRLVEPIMGVSFHIGPFTNFMSNMCTAQTKFQALYDLIQPTPNVTLVDICSGIGSIGLAMAKKCKEVYAIEMQEKHIADGVVTAQMNGIVNFSFLHGRAEELLGDLLKSLEGRNKEIVCVLDPPKLGSNKRTVLTDLAFRIVDQVRQSPSVKRFVYICNNQKGPVRLFLDFCASSQERGTYRFAGLPFVPVRIIPIDLAPHTPHYQLFVLFEHCSFLGSRKKPRKQYETANSRQSSNSSTYESNNGYC